MTDKQFALAINEAQHYTALDAYISDMLLSAAFLPPEDEETQPDISLAPALRSIWTAVAAPFRDLLAAMGLTQSACARRFGIPLRTVQSWALGERQCPGYVRLMMAELTGLIRR